MAKHVSIHGMYDAHLFDRFTGRTVEEVAFAWLQHCLEPHPAIVGEREVDDLGPTSLCPVIVLKDDKELRRVGPMVFWRNGAPDVADLLKWREACLNDPDIPRLLAKGRSEKVRRDG